MRWILTVAMLVSGALALRGQPSIQAQRAELAIPFGVAPGTVVLLEDYLVFVDQENPAASFAISRADIKEIRTEGDAVIVETARPIRDRTGSRSRVSFRFSGETGSGLLSAWHGGRGTAAAPAAAAASPEQGLTLSAAHNHRIGSCSGRLLIREDRIIYESVDNVGHSREWALSDIRKIEQKNPYELKVEPFRGGGYTFQLQGGGLESSEFQSLVDRIARARAGRRAQ